MDDINVQLLDFKITTADEMVTANEDGSYTILINSRQATNRQQDAYRHALEHIEAGDLNKGVDVAEAEARAHRLEEIKKREEEKLRKQRQEEEAKRQAAYKKKLDAVIRRLDKIDEDKKRYGIYKSRDIMSDPNDIGYDEPW